MPVHDFDPPERCVVGTVGPPGQRTFFVQARDAQRLVTASCEKEQLVILAARLVEILDEVPDADPSTAPVDNDPLDVPFDDDFRVSSLTLGWDATRRKVVIELRDADVDEAEDAGELADDVVGAQAAGTSIRVVLSAPEARELARRISALASAGRPPCPFCGEALSPNGHVCPRANGYRR